jgi:hypothetical protein
MSGRNSRYDVINYATVSQMTVKEICDLSQGYKRMVQMSVTYPWPPQSIYIKQGRITWNSFSGGVSVLPCD